MQTATREDILACFRLLLGREPSREEEKGHFLLAGAPLDSVVSSYIQSLEFRNRGLFQPGVEAEIVKLESFSIYVAKDDDLIAPGIRSGYEPELTQVFLERMGRGCILDIGANCGYFSLLAASRGARVYAFEPLQKNLRLLHASVILNGFRGIQVIGAAASDAAGTLTIGASFTNGIVGGPPVQANSALTADYIASVCVDQVLSGDSVSLIKIDVEGHEYRAIAGASQTIRNHRPAIISEFGPEALKANSGRTGPEYLELLRRSGYRYSVIGQPDACSIEAIMAACAGRDHVDILATPW